MWRCGGCGYVWDGEEPPEECPKCGAAEAKFVQIEAKGVELIDRSRFTNSLHMQLYVLLEQVMDVAEDGIDDNLDPGCVKIFRQTMDLSEIMQQSIKAELQAHMNKGKWG
jgi:predicted  nucleic acid-binding Zn-ribbon protein